MESEANCRKRKKAWPSAKYCKHEAYGCNDDK